MDRNEQLREYLLLEAKKELARNDYAEYCKYVHGGRWLLGKHLKLICDNVDKLINREMKENILIVSMPPQHGKSQCISETIASYYFGKNPRANIIGLSYGDDLAQRFGRKNKEKVINYGQELFGIELDRSSDALITIKDHGGTFITKGIMAGVTGNPADLVFLDDVIKNRQEADSEIYRDRIWEEYLASVNTRLSANGVVIVIMTRWHEDDLVGRLVKNVPNKCKVINIPLEAEENDVLGREVGDSLFPEIGKDKEWLQEFKELYIKGNGSRTWNALMQGRPSAAEGNMFKRDWWQFYDKLPRLPLTIMTVDATFKDTSKSDYVAIQVWGKVNNSYYLIDRLKRRMGFVDTISAIKMLKSKYPQISLTYIEDKANGSAIIEVLKKQLDGIMGYNPGKTSKEARASAITPLMEAGQVFLPKFGTNIDEYIEEFSAFPNGVNDDEVDSTSMALNILRRRIAIIETKEEFDPMYGVPWDNEYEEMLYNMTGMEINTEMFKWNDFR